MTVVAGRLPRLGATREVGIVDIPPVLTDQADQLDARSSRPPPPGSCWITSSTPGHGIRLDGLVLGAGSVLLALALLGLLVVIATPTRPKRDRAGERSRCGHRCSDRSRE
jgi:hypothetical protein